MTWENYFDSNIAFTVVLFKINAASGVHNNLAVPVPSPNENCYDELQ
jgi:hypothetical protein